MDTIVTFPLSQPVAIFTLVLLIILCGPLVFRRLKIPNIVGLIISGMLVGPNCFNLLENDASFRIFGQVGILFLMFLAAVEIDTYHLRKNLGNGIVFGVVSFVIPIIFGVAGSRIAFGAGWSTSFLIASMYAAHTLVSYPAVSKFGLQNTRGAVIAVCGTIVAVMLALFTLAETVGVARSGGFDPGYLLRLGLRMSVFALAVGYLYPWLTRLFFRNFSDQISQFIFILSLVSCASLVAHAIGLEAILGAFYAGLILNRFIPSRSGLMSRIKFMGNAIFIPYFLIGIGMLINVRVIFTSWNVGWIALNMTFVALSSKWFSAWITQKTLGLDVLDRRMMFGLTSGKAAATIAATMVGYQYGLLTEDMMNAAVVMILVCCIVASVETERAARKLRKRLTEDEILRATAPAPTHYARQLVAVSNPITSEGLMKIALLMRYRDNHEPVTALFVRREGDAGSIEVGRMALSAAVAAATSVDLEVKDIERFDLNIVAGVVNVMKENNCTDVIMGLHRRSNIVDSFHGTMIEQLLASTDKMVFLCRCFIPVDTIGRLLVVAPRDAEYETGFQAWVERVANLASQLSCRVVFMAYQTTAGFIRNLVSDQRYSVRFDIKILESWDDFILYSGKIDDDDLLMVIAARKGSISCTSDLEAMPTYLNRNFSRNNLIVVYPEQFGGNRFQQTD